MKVQPNTHRLRSNRVFPPIPVLLATILNTTDLENLTANMHHRLPLHHPPRAGVHLSEQESTYLRSVSASATSAASTTRLLFTK